jgi:hypothetical protein
MANFQGEHRTHRNFLPPTKALLVVLNFKLASHVELHEKHKT